MPNLRMIKEPGYIYDLFMVFFLKFNNEYCLDNYLNLNKQTEDIAYFNQIINEFDPISDDLFIFFYAIENGRCFMSDCYFNAYKKEFTTNYNFQFLQEKLRNHDKLIRKFIKFYLYNSSSEDIEKYLKSNVDLFSAIKGTDYHDSVKSRLYEFFINPTPYIQKLQYELMAKELKLAQYYEKNYRKIMDVQSEITFETLTEQLEGIDDLSFANNPNQQLYISFCLLRKNCLKLLFCTDGAVYLLGYDYIEIIKFIKDKENEPKLEEFGSALSDESRVKIIYLLLERDEINCKDLEKALDISGSTAYHHLTVMTRIGLIKTRNEGKTILYRLSKTYFDVIIDVLSKFSNKQKGKSS